MAKKISPETVQHVSQIARLKLTEKEVEKFAEELESILEAFRDLERIKTKGVKPSFHPIEIKNVLRKDEVEESLTQGEALGNTKNKEKGFFKGPRVA
ncbi:MAG: Asp-tRNA(Asn)/Glu-tRNA(Gln) amidotransferase subunit GatC [Candidatus Aenigmatarchaeota archaeon]